MLEQEALLTGHSALFLRFQKSSTSQISPASRITFDKKKKGKLRIASAHDDFCPPALNIRTVFTPRENIFLATHCSGFSSSLNDCGEQSRNVHLQI